jgi:hypothetical protein
MAPPSTKQASFKTVERDSPWVGREPLGHRSPPRTESPHDGIVIGELWFQRAGMSAPDGAPA